MAALRFLNSGAGNRQDGGAAPGGGWGDDGDSRDYGERLHRARLGLGVAIVIVVMLFLAFAAAFVARWLADWDSRAAHAWRTIPLPTALLVVNTFVLLLGSVTLELARRQASRRAVLEPIAAIPGISLGDERNVPWLPASLFLGCMFVAGQALAWRGLAAQGYLLDSGPSSSFFYLVTMLHAIHVGGGLLALIYAVSLPLFHRPWAARRIVVDIVAWYWHFLAALWIFLLGLLLVMH